MCAFSQEYVYIFFVAGKHNSLLFTVSSQLPLYCYALTGELESSHFGHKDLPQKYGKGFTCNMKGDLNIIALVILENF